MQAKWEATSPILHWCWGVVLALLDLHFLPQGKALTICCFIAELLRGETHKWGLDIAEFMLVCGVFALNKLITVWVCVIMSSVEGIAKSHEELKLYVFKNWVIQITLVSSVPKRQPAYIYFSFSHKPSSYEKCFLIWILTIFEGFRSLVNLIIELFEG